MKKYIVLFYYIIISCSAIYGQKNTRVKATFNKITQDEYALTSYVKDPNTPAVVLYESGRNTFEKIDNYLKLVKVVHKKIKIFDVKRFKGTEINIEYYHTKESSEKVTEIKAITHNGAIRKMVDEEDIFDVDVSDHWSEKRFTFPDVQDGSIIEYTYRIESPYFFNFGDWEFQGNIPKMYSEFSADIPGNYVYNRSIVGSKPLDINESKIKRNCFEISGLGSADCDASIYAMYDVPKYKEEDYMLSKQNYISRLSYELTETTSFRGVNQKYSKTWKDVDKEFKEEKDIGRQLKYASYFKNFLPQDVLSITDPRERAKAVYTHIQDHFTWNNKYRIFSGIRVKDAYQNKKGNIAEINLSLINALKVANIDAKLALSSTRNKGLPSALFPVLTDFNYVLAHVKFGEEIVLLDATDKQLSFGMLPFKALNIKARVMDFKKDSYWQVIVPQVRNGNYTNVQLYLTENTTIEGKVKEVYSGYKAYQWRKQINREGNTAVHREDTYSLPFELYDEKIENLVDLDKPLIINQSFLSDIEVDSDIFYFNPFLMNFGFEENMFKDENRMFPVDLGYPRSTTYIMTLDMKGIYKIVEMPENKRLLLPDGMGECLVSFSESENKLQSTFRFKFIKFRFTVEEYKIIREFFETAVALSKNSIVKLKKV